MRSSNDREGERVRSTDLYGQPLCSPFSASATGVEFLSSYHTCLASGCAVGVGRSRVWKELVDVGAGLPYPTNVQYIALIYAGKVRPDNYQTIIKQLQDYPLNSLFETNFSSIDITDIIPQLLSRADNESKSFQFPSPFAPSAMGSTNNLDSSSLTNFLSLLSYGGNEDFSQLVVNSGIIGNGLFPLQTDFNPIINTPCPYQHQQLTYPGLPLLSGSFEGCCEKSLCFTPRADLRTAHSGVSSYLYHWSSWGECSGPCGGGLKNRTRMCVGNHCDASTILLQTQTCNEHQCPYFSHWGAWSECSVTCGGGYKVRTRTCQGSGSCTGDIAESTLCQIGECPTYEYGQWSPCSNTCGVGIRIRTRVCISEGDYGCLPDVTDEGPCEQFCGRSNVQCNSNTCCYEQSCLQIDGSPGYCQRDSRAGIPCRIGFCLFRQSQRQCVSNGSASNDLTFPFGN